MKTRGIVVILILVVALGNVWPAGAQGGVVNLSIDGDLVLDEFPRTRALVTVRNENGVPIVGLGPDKFEIVEDGRASFPPSEVTTQVNPDAVISVVLVIDVSGSMRGKPIQEAMRAANALLDQLGPQDRVAIIAFADKVKSLDPAQLEAGKELGFTTDKNAARNVVNFLDTKIGWDTPLYDAIYKGVKMVSTEPAGKRAVVALTDGRDERDNAQGVAVKDAGSLSSPDDPINEANRHNIPIFTIGLVGLGGVDTKYLNRVAERTGGGYQQAPQPEELTPLFENVVNQLKQQYILVYDSVLPDNADYHSLLVRVQLPQGQAFDEIKFRIREPPPTEPPTRVADTTLSATVAPGQTSLPAAVVTPEPTPAGFAGIVDGARRITEEKPALVVVIGLGMLLLLLLVIALAIVLLRGRRTDEEVWTDEWGAAYSAAPTGPPPGGPPVMGAPTAGGTAVATPGWPGVGPGTPVASQPPIGVTPGPGIPQAGQTLIIERAPQHLALLVDKSRPERKYDLEKMTNIGRGRENQIVLKDPTVSRQHAWIKAEGEDFLVFDVGSANGTYVDDQKVEAPRRLENGDVIRFGEAQFVFTKVF